MFTNLDMAAFDDEVFAMNEGVGQFVAGRIINTGHRRASYIDCLLYTSDAADE